MLFNFFPFARQTYHRAKLYNINILLLSLLSTAHVRHPPAVAFGHDATNQKHPYKVYPVFGKGSFILVRYGLKGQTAVIFHAFSYIYSIVGSEYKIYIITKYMYNIHLNNTFL